MTAYRKTLFQALYIQHAMTPDYIKSIRQQAGFTQRRFADYIGISYDTYRNWEIGHCFPSGPSKALLYMAQTYPDVFQKNRKKILQFLSSCRNL